MKAVRRLVFGVFMLGTGALGACSDDNDLSGPGITAPTNLVVTATSSTTASVTWSAVSGATGYVVERKAGTGGFAQIGTATTTSFTDTGLSAGTVYTYRVAAQAGSATSGYSAEASTTPALAVRGDTIRADILSNRTLFADTTYVLSGFIHVANGATLTIQPGTRIVGDNAVLGSSLFIMRGAKINAVGTAAAPIVFTSGRPVTARAPGDWGGLIIVGNGIVNRTNVILEGTGTNAVTNPAITYSGGTNNADDSGELRYVRIEFAGFATATDAELNSLTLAAVGSGTDINFVQTLAGLDDSFEWFGGAVDARNLVSYESGDDHFDMSEGYQGRLQFLIGYQSKVLTPRQGAGSISTDPQGIENDGCNPPNCAAVPHNSTPLTTPVVANFTLVGRGVQGTGSGDVGMVLRRGTGGYYVNGHLGSWARAAISVRDSLTQQRIPDGDLVLSNILVTESPVIFQTGSGQQAGVDAAANNIVMIPGLTRTQLTALPNVPTQASDFDWSPSATGAQRTGGMTTFSGKLQAAAGTSVTGTSYRGAADPNGPKWWAGWTSYFTN